MTGRLIKLLPGFALLRLAAIPLFALLILLVSGDGVRAAGTFNPSNTSTYCAQGTGDIDDQQLTVTCTPDISPGSHPDIVSSFDIGVGADGKAGTGDDTGDYNFGGVVAFAPTIPDDTAIPVGAILGRLGSQPTLGLVNGGCGPIPFVRAYLCDAKADASLIVYNSWRKDPTPELSGELAIRRLRDEKP